MRDTGVYAASDGGPRGRRDGTPCDRRYLEIVMRTATISLLFLLPVLACDPDDAGKSRSAKTAARPATAPASAPAAPAAPTMVKAGPPAPPVEETRPAVTGDGKGLAQCLTACDEQKLSPTDRATCRMNCDGVHNVPATTVAAGTADGGVEGAVECISKCHEAKSGDACVQTCKTDAGKSVNAPAQSTLDQLGTCLGACYTNKRLNDTDRETCKLNCEQIASVAGPGDSKPKPGKGT
jgi:hypothetical protein